MKYRAEMKSLQELKQKRGLQKHGAVQRFVDSEVLRLCEPMVPFQTGNLKNSGIHGTDVGSGEVKYNAPYARFQYYGKVMVNQHGSPWAKRGERKHVTGKNLTYNGAPQRGSYFFERMKSAHLQEILQGAAIVAGGKGRR